jgi:hypothetical protein
VQIILWHIQLPWSALALAARRAVRISRRSDTGSDCPTFPLFAAPLNLASSPKLRSLLGAAFLSWRVRFVCAVCDRGLRCQSASLRTGLPSKALAHQGDFPFTDLVHLASRHRCWPVCVSPASDLCACVWSCSVAQAAQARCGRAPLGALGWVFGADVWRVRPAVAVGLRRRRGRRCCTQVRPPCLGLFSFSLSCLVVVGLGSFFLCDICAS